MPQPLAPKGGNDRIYTPPPLAKAIVAHYQPWGDVIEPCSGRGAFSDALLPYSASLRDFEIDDGDDFLAWEPQDPIGDHFNWCITNPPWSKFRPFLQKAMQVSDNVVFLCLVNAFFMRARQEDMRKAGFGMKEILFAPTPPKPWPQTGFSLGAVHVQRHYHGPVTISHLESY